jgi:Family of unknown function (DUF5906)
MAIVDLFIQAGWHTVPLKGELTRLNNGKKTVPVFELDWKAKYAKTFNTYSSKLAGALTGKVSGICAIDCDNEATYKIFDSLNPNYVWKFHSKDKPEGGCTIIYKYTEDVNTFSLNSEGIKLDYFSDEGFIYLPTENNFTKQPWPFQIQLPELEEMPDNIKVLLQVLKIKGVSNTPIVENKQGLKYTISNRLAPMLDDFVAKKEYSPMLFKILTPYSFRDLPSYVTKGHLHPNDVPSGRGSEYLSKISAILGADISVNIELYIKTMTTINSMWNDPMHIEHLNATIINPMIEGKSSINGNPIWTYDVHWAKMGFMATTSNGDYIESFYDDVKGLYYLINYTVPYIKTYTDKRPLLTTLKTLLARNVTETQYDVTKQLVRARLYPANEFGHIEGTDQFNLFRQTAELGILTNHESYATSYKRPNTIIKYFETLIPDDFMRAYVLSFIKTKLSTFKYSPIILYLIGVPGSGKDTLVNLIGNIIGKDYVAKPDSKVFLEQYNGWLLDKYIVQLDEYGNKLVRQSEKQEVLGKLKAYTGSPNIQIRAMRSDGYNYSHSTLFVLTANSNPLPIETDDRRVCFIKTPNKLASQDWVKEAGGIVAVIERINLELMDFCYYLATEVKMLSNDEYVIPPETKDKEDLILAAMNAVDQITFYIAHSQLDKLIDLATEYGISNFTEGWSKCRLLDSKLFELYSAMTDGAGANKTLIRVMKNAGFSRSHTTMAGQQTFYYHINDLYKFAAPEGVSPDTIETISNTKTVKGL